MNPILDPLAAWHSAAAANSGNSQITQTVRVGARTWPAATGGVFRHIDYLATGLSTERVPEDDIVVPVVHFTKDNGELSSISLDEHTKVEKV